jgi:hypothetical protein
MAQLRSCYFCGTTGTLSEYETVPADLRTGAEATSRKVVLCDRCHTKLTEIVRPIVDRVESDAASERDAPGVDDHSSDRPTGTGGSDALRPSDDRSPQPEVTFVGRSGATPADSAPDDPVRVDDAVDGADATSGTEGETASEPDGSPDAETAGADGEDGTNDADGTGNEDDDAERSEDAAEGNERETDDGSDTTDRDDLDRVYYQLLRFLRNREFPIPRPEAEVVAQSAYDLTASEASRVIQRAVDREVLEERNGQLHRN